MASATWRRFLVASLVIIAAYRILPPSPVVRMVAYNGFAACCVAGLCVATRQQRVKRRLAWYLITGGVLMFVLGDAIYTAWDPLLGTPPPFPNVGDAFYLACYPLLVGGLATLIRARTPGRDWASLIDATIIATGLGVLAWVFLIAPHASDPSLSLNAKLILTSYPTMDVALLAATARLAVGGGARPPALVLLAGAAVALLVTDAIYGLQLLAGTYELGGPLDAGWMLFYALTATAALHPSAAVLSEPAPVPSERISRGRLALLAAAALLAPAVTVHYSRAASGAHASDFLVAGVASAVLFVLVIARTAGLLGALQRSMAQVADLQRERGERRFRSLVQNSTDVVALLDAGGIVTYVSPSIERVSGHSSNDVMGTSLLDLVHPEDLDGARSHISDGSAPGGLSTLEFRMRNAGGTWRWVEGSVSNLLHDPDVEALVINYRDVTERKALENQLVHQAFHDPLTKLANRALFRDRVQHALSHQRRNRAPLAVMFMDIDDFKTVNDSLGHEAGDKLLIEVARRLQSMLRTSDTAARLGGDEFALLVEILSHPEDTATVAERVIDSLREPFEVSGRQLRVHASVGIAIAGLGDDDTDQLLRNADVAMHRAKSHGKGRYELYEKAMHAAVLERLELKADLGDAIAKQQFLLHYQPIVALDHQRIVGVEALLRWEHPTRGIISPAQFIPLAEDTGLIVPIGRWVLLEACRQARSWQSRRGDSTALFVAVNLSAKQLEYPHLVEEVRACLAETGLASKDLTLEITESMLMRDIEGVLVKLGKLKEIGVKLAVDDFGTGYSSLSYLQRFPIDRLKIDKSFVDGVALGDHGSALARAVIGLGDSLHLRTVAEGIESADQVSSLIRLGCEFGQGYYFGRPLPPEDIESRLMAAAPVGLGG